MLKVNETLSEFIVQNGPLIWPTIKQENGTVRPKTNEDLSGKEKLQADCDLKVEMLEQQDLSLVGETQLVVVVELAEVDMHIEEQKVECSQGNTSSQEKVVKCYNYHGKGHMARQCTQPKRRRDATWFKKVLLVQAHAEGKELDEEQLAFLADPEVHKEIHQFKKRLSSAIIIMVKGTWLDNVLNQREEEMQHGLKKVLLVQAHAEGKELDEEQLAFLADPEVADVLMANLSSCDLDVLSKVPYSNNFQNDMMSQSVQELLYSEQPPIVDYLDNEITSYSNIIPYSKYLEEKQHAIVQNTNASTQQNSMIISMFEQMSNHATKWDKANSESKIVNESLTAELERYKK
nr:hypothetical protein [Tanacetum cinerariifolium]